jgi:hypothetical protein
MPGAQIDGFYFDVEDAFIELTAQSCSGEFMLLSRCFSLPVRNQ